MPGHSLLPANFDKGHLTHRQAVDRGRRPYDNLARISHNGANDQHPQAPERVRAWLQHLGLQRPLRLKFSHALPLKALLSF